MSDVAFGIVQLPVDDTGTKRSVMHLNVAHISQMRLLAKTVGSDATTVELTMTNGNVVTAKFSSYQKANSFVMSIAISLGGYL